MEARLRLTGILWTPDENNYCSKEPLTAVCNLVEESIHSYYYSVNHLHLFFPIIFVVLSSSYNLQDMYFPGLCCVSLAHRSVGGAVTSSEEFMVKQGLARSQGPPSKTLRCVFLIRLQEAVGVRRRT